MRKHPTNALTAISLGLSTMPWRCIGEWRYSSTHSLTSALDGGEWSASRLAHFTPRERAPGTHGIGSWVDPRAVLDAVVKRKIPSPHRESNPRTPIVQPVAQRYTDCNMATLISTVQQIMTGLQTADIEKDRSAIIVRAVCGLVLRNRGHCPPWPIVQHY
jgi:hypothetical protein